MPTSATCRLEGGRDVLGEDSDRYGEMVARRAIWLVTVSS